MDTGEIDRELDDLELRIDRLRALYEQYFLGIEKMEPSIPRRDAERKMQVLRKEQIRNTAQRFKFQMLVQRYNTMQQHWARVTREIENGTYRRDVMRAAARFGEKEALTIFGKRRQKQYAVLAEAQTLARNKRRGPSDDDALELADSDLLVDDDDDGSPSAVANAPISSGEPGSSQRKAPLGGLRWSGQGPGDPASAVRSTEAQTGVKRRLAELAASMRAPAPGPSDDIGTPRPRAIATPPEAAVVRVEASGFGALDLDFDESAASQRAALLRKPGITAAPIAGAAIPTAPSARPPPGAPRPGAPSLRPAPPPEPPAARPPASLAPRSPAMFSPPPTSPPAARASAPPVPRGPSKDFGALDLPFDSPPSATLAPRPLAPSLAPVRPTALPPPRALSVPASPPVGAPIPSAAPPAPARSVPAAPRPPPLPVAPPAAASEGALPDQRLRQIYAKYVEAKRSANESTAGVTYEKLAETLRAQANRLKATHPAKSVDYDVVIKDGKALLKPVLR